MKEALLIILFLSATYAHGQSVLINEFMAKNNSTIQDEDGDFSDWIELYNTTDSTISLHHYRLSDDRKNLNKWIFPEISIPPNGYLLVFASDKNRLDTTALHTNFKISSSGEQLYLSDNFGTIIDQTDAVHLTNDASYARIPDGSDNWHVVYQPTPNSTNNNSNVLFFSHQGGFYTSPFYLKINSLSTDTIYYTLNGDIPTEQSNVLTDALLIEDRSSTPNIFSEIPTTPEQKLIAYKAWESPSGLIDKATVLRCVSYKNGIKTSKVYTKTFFVGEDIFGRYSMPVISLITEGNNLFSADSGIYVPGINYNSNDPEWSGNYSMRGENWERTIHIEYFENDGSLGFSQNAGVRIHGGKTRQAAQKSLRLYARNKYGKKHFNYPLLPQRQVDQYKRLILRTTMGSWEGQSIIKDVLSHQIASELNIDYQEFQPVIVYINGEYWGIHTIRDRIDERYIEYTHNIDSDSVEFKQWNNADYNQLMKFIENNDISLNSTYEYVKTKIDLDNYIDYTIAEFFFANYDWPSNNIELWRKIPDGKWRWIFYDIDAGFRSVDYNMFIHSTKNDPSVTWPNSPQSTFLFRSLIKNETFVSQFVHRYAEILNQEFHVDVTTKKLDAIKKLYAPEIRSHISRWHYPYGFSSWEKDIEQKLLAFLQKRPCAVRNNIMAFFSLSDFGFECDFKVDEENKHANLILAPNPTTGNFFLFNNRADITNATILLINMNGQVVYREDGIDIMQHKRKYFQLSHLPTSTYILQVIYDQHSEQKKIIIMD